MLELDCNKCEDETLHVQEGDERYCLECGNITEYADWNQAGYVWKRHKSITPIKEMY